MESPGNFKENHNMNNKVDNHENHPVISKILDINHKGKHHVNYNVDHKHKNTVM